MSKIDEIRKRIEAIGSVHASESPAVEHMPRAVRTAVSHRGELLAIVFGLLDGEWQNDRPTPGMWWVSIAPETRPSPGRPDLIFPAVRECWVWPTASGGFEVTYTEHGHAMPLDQDWFTGAKWQRRTVPSDPFAKGGGE